MQSRMEVSLVSDSDPSPIVRAAADRRADSAAQGRADSSVVRAICGSRTLFED